MIAAILFACFLAVILILLVTWGEVLWLDLHDWLTHSGLYEDR